MLPAQIVGSLDRRCGGKEENTGHHIEKEQEWEINDERIQTDGNAAHSISYVLMNETFRTSPVDKSGSPTKH